MRVRFIIGQVDFLDRQQTAAGPHGIGPQLIKPKPLGKAEQPAVKMRPRFEMPRLFKRMKTGRLGQIIGPVTIAGQCQTITP